jgi:hypothetical protein
LAEAVPAVESCWSAPCADGGRPLWTTLEVASGGGAPAPGIPNSLMSDARSSSTDGAAVGAPLGPPWLPDGRTIGASVVGGGRTLSLDAESSGGSALHGACGMLDSVGSSSSAAKKRLNLLELLRVAASSVFTSVELPKNVSSSTTLAASCGAGSSSPPPEVAAGAFCKVCESCELRVDG